MIGWIDGKLKSWKRRGRKDVRMDIRKEGTVRQTINEGMKEIQEKERRMDGWNEGKMIGWKKGKIDGCKQGRKKGWIE